MTLGAGERTNTDALVVGPDRAPSRLEPARLLFPAQPGLPGAAGGPGGPPGDRNLKGAGDEGAGPLAGRREIPVAVAALLRDEAEPPIRRPAPAGQREEASAGGPVEPLDQGSVYEQLHARRHLVHVLPARPGRPHLPRLERGSGNGDAGGDGDRVGHGGRG